MRNILTKITHILLILFIWGIGVQTISCSSGDDGGQGVPFNENSQIYNEDGTLYKGSGIVEWLFYDDDYENDTIIQIISVKNGIVKLELPPFPAKYPYNDGWIRGCDVSPKGTPLYAEDDFVFRGSDGKEEHLWLGYLDNGYQYFVFFIYSPTDAKITCRSQDNVNAKAGWNKIYAKIHYHPCDDDEKNEECYSNAEKDNFMSTNNFFTKEAKWTLGGW